MPMPRMKPPIANATTLLAPTHPPNSTLTYIIRSIHTDMYYRHTHNVLDSIIAEVAEYVMVLCTTVTILVFDGKLFLFGQSLLQSTHIMCMSQQLGNEVERRHHEKVANLMKECTSRRQQVEDREHYNSCNSASQKREFTN